jgi:CzcA family heavy metal efflux pump
MKITETALKFKTTIYVLVAFIVIVGVVSYRSLPLEAAPEVKIPIDIVSTVYPGVSPEDMERLVTNVLEGELKDLKGIKQMTSTSSESLSMVTVEFESGVDLDVAYQKVRDKVDKAKRRLPADAEEPQIIEINVSDFPIMLVNISGEYGLEKLKTVGEGLRDKIEQIPGVLGVDLTGGVEREIQVFLNPAKMQHYRLGVGQIVRRIQEEHRTTPAGNLTLAGSKYSVRIPGEYKQVALMEEIVLKAPDGRAIQLKDVGRVVDGFEERATLSRVDGAESVTLRIKKRAGENIVRIVDEVRALLEKERPGFPPTTATTIRQDQSESVRDMVSDLENNIITGLILVLGVLLFAMGLRNAFFVAIAIPMSMLMSFIMIQAMGITLNMVVLFSLILALGMLVDNSIVVVENIYRHISDGESRVKAALNATKEVAWPIIASTATTVMVFVPLIFWPGIMGSFMVYLPITVISVLASSLFVALVINPTIASGFLKAGVKKMFDDSGEAKGWLVAGYQRILSWSLDRPKRVLAISAGVLVATVLLFAQIGTGVEFFPESTPERAQVHITAPKGTELYRTNALVKQVEEIARKEENVVSVVANVGVSGGQISGSENAVVDIEFKDRHERKGSTLETMDAIREKLQALPGAEYQLKLEEMGPPTGAPVSVEISGPDYGKLEELASHVKALIRSIPGLVDLKDDYEKGKPEIRVEVDRKKAMQRKVNTQAVATAVRAAINGIDAAVLREGDQEYDIVVRYDEPYRQSINDILNIRVTGEDNVQIPLRDVARVTTTGGVGSINHIDQNRTIAVTADVTGRSSTEVMMDVAKILDERLSLPSGYALEFSGESSDQEESSRFLSRAFGIGLMLMFMILITQFNSIQRPGIILGSVGMSVVGVLLGLMVTGNKFSIIMTGLGIISLAGVVVNNAIVLIDYTDKLKARHGLSLKAALKRAGVVRFRPVLLTAITTVLGLLPMALGVSIDFKTLSIDIGAPSTEFWGPMAQAVSFGLLFATMLTLVIVPVMYLAQQNSTDWLAEKARRAASLLRRPQKVQRYREPEGELL